VRLSFDKIAGIELKEEVTRGGIHIPGTHQDTSRTATKRIKVTHVGPGYYAIELGRRVTVEEQLGHPLQVGDVIVCSRFLYEHEIHGRKYRIFQASDVLCVEDPEDAPRVVAA
jgi:co-chaperonin GroES (HSP10)